MCSMFKIPKRYLQLLTEFFFLSHTNEICPSKSTYIVDSATSSQTSPRTRPTSHCHWSRLVSQPLELKQAYYTHRPADRCFAEIKQWRIAESVESSESDSTFVCRTFETQQQQQHDMTKHSTWRANRLKCAYDSHLNKRNCNIISLMYLKGCFSAMLKYLWWFSPLFSLMTADYSKNKPRQQHNVCLFTLYK